MKGGSQLRREERLSRRKSRKSRVLRSTDCGLCICPGTAGRRRWDLSGSGGRSCRVGLVVTGTVRKEPWEAGSRVGPSAACGEVEAGKPPGGSSRAGGGNGQALDSGPWWQWLFGGPTPTGDPLDLFLEHLVFFLSQGPGITDV